MITPRLSSARGQGHYGWLEARYSFSFGDYIDPNELGWGVLRVINEDRVQPGEGFPTHGHRDMEILTYVLEGELEHKDSMGNGARVLPGEVQVMSAGDGVRHSEFNASATKVLHLLQIWITPAVNGGPPSYAQQVVPDKDKRDRLCQIASPDGAEGSLKIRQNARIYASLLSAAKRLKLTLEAGRLGYLHVVRGQIHAGNKLLKAGDALKLRDEPVLDIVASEDAEILFFDLPGEGT